MLDWIGDGLAKRTKQRQDPPFFNGVAKNDLHAAEGIAIHLGHLRAVEGSYSLFCTRCCFRVVVEARSVLSQMPTDTFKSIGNCR